MPRNRTFRLGHRLHIDTAGFMRRQQHALIDTISSTIFESWKPRKLFKDWLPWRIRCAWKFFERLLSPGKAG
jgi:hypothetical protein